MAKKTVHEVPIEEQLSSISEKDKKTLKTKIKTYNVVFITLSILLLSTIGLLASVMHKNSTLEAKAEVATEELKAAIEEEFNKSNKLAAKLLVLHAEYEEYKTENNPNDRDFDKQAIMGYIQTNYKRIPKELVESIATHTIIKSTEHNIPYELVVAITEIESNFNPTVVSSKKARGLMQVTPGVWGKPLGIENKFEFHEVDTGLDAGIRVIKHYLSGKDGGEKDNLERALYLYVGKDKDYVNKVLNAMGNFVLFKSSL